MRLLQLIIKLEFAITVDLTVGVHKHLELSVVHTVTFLRSRATSLFIKLTFFATRKMGVLMERCGLVQFLGTVPDPDPGIFSRQMRFFQVKLFSIPDPNSSCSVRTVVRSSDNKSSSTFYRCNFNVQLGCYSHSIFYNLSVIRDSCMAYWILGSVDFLRITSGC